MGDHMQQLSLWQSQGTLLDGGKLAALGSSVTAALWQLRKPCKALRELLLRAPLDELLDTRDRHTRVPYPLNPPPTTYTSYLHLDYRLRANFINENTANLDAECSAALLWFQKHLQHGNAATGMYGDHSIAPVKRVTGSATTESETMPPDLDIAMLEEEDVGVPWLRVRVEFKSMVTQNMWCDSMTPHTGVMLFLVLGTETWVLTGYTLLGKKKEKDVEKGETELLDDEQERQEQQKKDNMYAHDLYVRLSTVAFVGDRYLEKLVRNDLPEHSVEGLYTAKGVRMFMARLDTMFFDEYDLTLLPQMNKWPSGALTDPLGHAFSLDDEIFDPPFALSNDEMRALAERARTYIAFPMAPQQLRYAFTFVAFLLLLGRPGSQFSLLPLGGPPGTGKTQTLCCAIILSRQWHVVDWVFETLNTHREITLDAEVVDNAMSQRLIYMAPTNEAVDAAMTTLIECRAYLAEEDRGDDNPVRVMRFLKAQRKPHLLQWHVMYKAAKIVRQACLAEAKAIQDTVGVRAGLVKGTKKDLHNKVISEEECEALLQEIDRAHPINHAAANAANKKKQNLEKQADEIQSFINNPAEYGSEYITGKKRPLRQVVAKKLRETAAEHVILDHANICFMTTGFASPYNPEAMEARKGAVGIIDEGTQAPPSDLIRSMMDTIGLVVCGDVNQLGATVKGPKEGTCDMRISMMEKLRSKTLWLTLCFRLPTPVTSFLGQHRYGNGLHSPTGQNIIRWSPLHLLDLFGPVLVIDVRGIATQEGKSKSNESECEAILEYLMEHYLASTAVSGPPCKVRVITPYTAQSQRLAEACKPFHGCAAFSSLDVGTIQTAQGATTDLCVVSLTAARTATGKLPDISFIDEARLTVALSRARHHLVVVCDFDALEQATLATPNANPLLEAFLAHPFPRHTYSKGSLRQASAAPSASIPSTLSVCGAPASEQEWLAQGESRDTEQVERRVYHRCNDLTNALSL